MYKRINLSVLAQVKADEKESEDVSTATDTEKETTELSLPSGKFMVSKLEEALAIVKEHEIQNTVRFVTQYSTKLNAEDIYNVEHKVYWQDGDVPFSGIPFMVLGHRALDCQHGKDKNVTGKIKQKAKRDALAANLGRKRKQSMVQATKKFGCTAKATIKEIGQFPEHKISDNTKWKRDKAAKKLRTLIKDKKNVELIRKYIVTLPDVSSHHGHPVFEAAGMSQDIDPILVERITSLVNEGVTSIQEMVLHLNVFVKNELFAGTNAPSKTNKRFYPSNKTIRNHMAIAKRKQKQTVVEETLQEKVERWSREHPDAKIFFHPQGILTAPSNQKVNAGEGEGMMIAVDQILVAAFQQQNAE